ncbi:MAG: phytanoyl-CoA dioxygenase family protein [Planctomycetes bacterium]|nr:phytanoyl-CoA dioxygenase family protein [Planctomycetota bacterium]
MLTRSEADFFWDKGYLHIPGVFTPRETDELAEELDWLIEKWADKSPGWSGPWRKKYMDEETEKKSMLIAMHDLHFYSVAWMRAVTNPKLSEAMKELLGPHVELHHCTMHVKPPETGHPFPMHQDWAFYQHADNRYVDTLVHLDHTSHENGEIRFLAGSHKGGALEHVTRFPDGTPCTPHLPTDRYRIEDTVAVPARRGDVVCFNIHTIHGSHINRTGHNRRLVRIGFKNPENVQTGGQSMARPGLMVSGRRLRTDGQKLFSTAGPK